MNRPSRNFALVGVARDQSLKGGQQHLVHGGVVAAAIGLEPGGQSNRKQRGFNVARIAFLGTAWLVGGQIDCGTTAVNMLAPVGQGGLGCVAFEPVLLPNSEVSKLEGKLRQGRFSVLRERSIEIGEVADQDAIRPAIADDVVHGEGEIVQLLY